MSESLNVTVSTIRNWADVLDKTKDEIVERNFIPFRCSSKNGALRLTLIFFLLISEHLTGTVGRIVPYVRMKVKPHWLFQ